MYLETGVFGYGGKIKEYFLEFIIFLKIIFEQFEVPNNFKSCGNDMFVVITFL